MTKKAAEDTPEKDLPVAAISSMDKETFCKHMTVRHLDSLADLSELSPHIGEYEEGMYRAFHGRLHAHRIDLGHEHDPGDPEQHWQGG